MAQVGVFEVPRVQLIYGLFRTTKRPTSVPTAVALYDRHATVEIRFITVGRPEAGVKLI